MRVEPPGWDQCPRQETSGSPQPLLWARTQREDAVQEPDRPHHTSSLQSRGKLSVCSLEAPIRGALSQLPDGHLQSPHSPGLSPESPNTVPLPEGTMKHKLRRLLCVEDPHKLTATPWQPGMVVCARGGCDPKSGCRFSCGYTSRHCQPALPSGEARILGHGGKSAPLFCLLPWFKEQHVGHEMPGD